MDFIEGRILGGGLDTLPAYNDAAGRTVDEVLDLFERSAVLAEKAGD